MTFEEKLNEVRYEGMEKGIAVGEKRGMVAGERKGKALGTKAVVETYYELGQDREAALTAVKKAKCDNCLRHDRLGQRDACDSKGGCIHGMSMYNTLYVRSFLIHSHVHLDLG